MDIRRIIFIKKSPFRMEYLFLLQLNGNENMIRFTGLESRTDKESINSKVVNDTIVTNFLEHFFRIVSNWNDTYINKNTLDATTWNIVIEYKNGKQKEYQGVDSYPINFDSLERLIDKTIKEIGGD